jgi:hypothetical protein
MKHEWRKSEKNFFLPKNKPEIVEIPEFGYFTVEGNGNPNDEHFSQFIEVLYSLSYAVRMSPKKGLAPDNYFEYTVYPLEGIWDIADSAKEKFDGTLNKDYLIFKLMIKQPDFVDIPFAEKIIEITKEKKPNQLLGKVRFEKISDGKCIQMLHIGSYDNEPESFGLMEDFAKSKGLHRISKNHKEIYLSDARKVPSEKLKTVLRFQVE